MNLAELSQLPELSNEEFLAELANIRPYTACLLKKGPNLEPPRPDHTTGVTKIIWRHGKRNTALHRAGLLPIVCPVSDNSELAGLGIFSATADEVNEIMSEDPAIKAHVLTYELHATRSFAGSTLPDTDIGNGNAPELKRSLIRDAAARLAGLEASAEQADERRDPVPGGRGRRNPCGSAAQRPVKAALDTASNAGRK